MKGPRVKYRLGRGQFRNLKEGTAKEWLLTNGIGGYANSTVCGNSNRIFSAYLIAAKHPPTDRLLILAKTHEELIIRNQTYDLATQEYPGMQREGYRYLTGFTFDIYPEYCYRVAGVTMKKRLALEYGQNRVALAWELENGGSDTQLSLTPLFNYRPFGAVSEKKDLNFRVRLDADTPDGMDAADGARQTGTMTESGGRLTLIPEQEPKDRIVFEASEGSFYDRKQKPVSMATPNSLVEENEYYATDAMNGFTGVDNHATPYELQVCLKPFEKKTLYCLCSLETESVQEKRDSGWTEADTERVAATARRIFAQAEERAEQLLAMAEAEDDFTGRLVLAADAFLVERESTGKKTILAGYPWFSDWGRDTMIAFTGLTLATGRFAEAREVLESFAQYVKNGMIPNVFPGQAGEPPAYNTIDASLWYFYAVRQYLSYTGDEAFVQEQMYPVLREIFTSYRDGRALYGIHMESDGLISGGSDLDQLTWMDVRVGELVVTPRHGKAVEINALWYNALRFLEELAGDRKEAEAAVVQTEPARDESQREHRQEYHALAEQVKQSFAAVFWNEAAGCLYDVVDEKGVPDASIRPNQIYAVALPYALLTPEQEKQIVQRVYEELYTPYGLRSLSPADYRYKPEYRGKLLERDLAYHMGTAWAYLAGALFTAMLKVGGSKAREQVRELCLCFMDHMADGCLGSIAEIFDGDFACESRGCYAQAWSVGELLRVWKELG